MDWSESLPDKCPPEDAISPEGYVLFRLCRSSVPNEDDFKSLKTIYPNRKFGNVSECVARSLSTWDNIDKCIGLLKLPRHKGKKVMKLELSNLDGLILQTYKRNHYSWWKTQSFKLISVKVVK